LRPASQQTTISEATTEFKLAVLIKALQKVPDQL